MQVLIESQTVIVFFDIDTSYCSTLSNIYIFIHTDTQIPTVRNDIIFIVMVIVYNTLVPSR